MTAKTPSPVIEPMPSGIDAEKWLDPDTFVYQDHVYHITLKGEVIRDDNNLTSPRLTK